MRMTIWRMIAWEKIIPSVHQKRIGGRIANEILMYFRRKKKNAQDVYISDPIDTDGEGNSLTLMDILADERSIYESIEAKFNCEQLYRLMNTCLDDREREILYLRYGLGGTRSYTQREVASRLGISRSYISRIEKKALEKLRKALGG